MGSSGSGDFTFDYGSSFTEEQQASGTVDYNFGAKDTTWLRTADAGTPVEHAAMTGTDTATYMREHPGVSAFIRVDGAVYHTYSAYSRGIDAVWGMYQWLDRAPLGRNETGAWWRRHDEYPQAAATR